MEQFFSNIGKWVGEQWDALTDFIKANHGNPLLWVGLLVIGFAIFKWAYSALDTSRKGI